MTFAIAAPVREELDGAEVVPLSFNRSRGRHHGPRRSPGGPRGARQVMRRPRLPNERLPHARVADASQRGKESRADLPQVDRSRSRRDPPTWHAGSSGRRPSSGMTIELAVGGPYVTSGRSLGGQGLCGRGQRRDGVPLQRLSGGPCPHGLLGVSPGSSGVTDVSKAIRPSFTAYRPAGSFRHMATPPDAHPRSACRNR